MKNKSAPTWRTEGADSLAFQPRHIALVPRSKLKKRRLFTVWGRGGLKMSRVIWVIFCFHKKKWRLENDPTNFLGFPESLLRHLSRFFQVHFMTNPLSPATGCSWWPWLAKWNKRLEGFGAQSPAVETRKKNPLEPSKKSQNKYTCEVKSYENRWFWSDGW